MVTRQPVSSSPHLAPLGERQLEVGDERPDLEGSALQGIHGCATTAGSPPLPALGGSACDGPPPPPPRPSEHNQVQQQQLDVGEE